MADEGFDWGSVTGHTVELLKKPKIPDVPAQIVALAQASYDGRPLRDDTGKVVKDDSGNEVLTHNMHHRFPSEEVAATFAKHMRNAGHHTTPLTSVEAVVDPMQTQDKRTVGWKAGKRRGRGATA